MRRKILHVLAQRPSLTGSGVSLDALVRFAAESDWEQRVVVGVPTDDPHPAVGGLPPTHVRPLVFGTGRLDFPIPGMSDVMPYPSSRFAELTATQLDDYRGAWKDHLAEVVADFTPDVVHVHHIWILGSLIKDVLPETPVVSHCHATGLRQLRLCPHLAAEVVRGVARNDAFVVLHREQARELAEAVGVAPDRIHRIGAGYREELFRLDETTVDRAGQLAYAGKYAAAKGVPWLLDALDSLASTDPHIRLHVAGGGAGEEAEALLERMTAMDKVEVHGQLSQSELAQLLNRCAVFVLPSFYEGLPLVLAEALACGCRLVATQLPGVAQELAPHVRPYLELVPLPPMLGVDTPDPAGLEAFSRDLTEAISRAAAAPAPAGSAEELTRTLAPFTWRSVFRRVEGVWSELVAG